MLKPRVSIEVKGLFIKYINRSRLFSQRSHIYEVELTKWLYGRSVPQMLIQSKLGQYNNPDNGKGYHDQVRTRLLLTTWGKSIE